jgi:hypothetical protein
MLVEDGRSSRVANVAGWHVLIVTGVLLLFVGLAVVTALLLSRGRS